MFNLSVIGRVFLALMMLAAAETGVAQTDGTLNQKHRPLSLYATHGYSHVHNHQLKRLLVSDSSFTVAAGAGYHLPSGLGVDMELLALGNKRENSGDSGNRYAFQSITTYQQERFSLGGSYRHSLSDHFALFPEAGISWNAVRVGLREFSYNQTGKAHAWGWYLGAGAVIPIRRVFFDLRAKYSVVDLQMEGLGVDSPMYQTTVLVGFGFVI
jgi:opacity protein-like surface antigen